MDRILRKGAIPTRILRTCLLATVSIVDYVTVVSGIGGSYATLTFAPDAAVGIESATVLIERVCG